MVRSLTCEERCELGNARLSGAEMLGYCTGEGATPVAWLTYIRHSNGFELLEIAACEREDVEEAFRALLGAMVTMSRESALPASIKFFEERPDREALCKAATAAGFVRLSGLYYASSFADVAMGLRWEAFMKKEERFFRRLVEKGYVNKPLTDIPEADRTTLYAHIKEEYNYNVHEAGQRTPADEENCFFTYRGDRLAAFCVVLRASPTQLIFDFGGAFESERRGGAFLLPLCAFISKLFAYDETQTIVYLFHEDNVEMLNLARNTLRIVIDSVKYKMNYYHAPRESLHPLLARGGGTQGP